MGIQDRLRQFEKVEEDANNEEVQAKFISDNSDRKKYNFVSGLGNDVKATRDVLTEASNGTGTCKYGDVFALADEQGGIANLSRVLQNLKKAEEIHFKPEIMFQGEHKDEVIELLPAFQESSYEVTDKNCFQKPIADTVVPHEQRKGRSYIQENQATRGVTTCHKCGEEVAAEQRLAFRGQVYHTFCLSCAQCSQPIRDKIANVTFDGKIACSAACIKAYDGIHQQQTRN